MVKEVAVSSKIFSSIKSLRIILSYVCLSAIWIFISNNYLGKLLLLSQLGTWTEILKEWIYVIFTSAFLYFVINRSLFLINRSKDEAERANMLKTEFLAQISHEIRTPLNVSLSFISKIKWELEDKLTPDLMNDFIVIEKSDKRLIRTIDLILEMSEMQLGTYKPTFNDVDLINDVLENIQTDFLVQCEKKGLVLNFIYKVDEAKLNCDFQSVSRIFVNIMDNAIKYTEQGKIEVVLDRNSNNELTISIIDTGIGISSGFVPKLFDPFSQEEQGYLRSYEGNGLGLALVKKYCELNNASIIVESEKKKGTKFTVTFHNHFMKKLN